MPWNTPMTWATNQLVTAANLNEQLRDNMSYLHGSKPLVAIRRMAGSNYTTTSSAYVDVDSINLRADFSTTTGRVLVACFASVYKNAGTSPLNIEFALDVDGAVYENKTMMRHTIPGGENSIPQNVGFVTVLDGLSAGSHTLKWKWRGGADGITMQVIAAAALFSVYEV